MNGKSGTKPPKNDTVQKTDTAKKPQKRNTVRNKTAVPTLPPENKDLKILVLKRKLTLAGTYLLWLACLAVGVAGFNSGHEKHPMELWQIALWLGGGAVIGFALLRVWRLFTDRTFTGKIIRSGLSHGVKGDDFKTNTAIKIQTGKRNRRLHFDQKENFYTLYHEDVEICKFSFLTYPLPNPETVGINGINETNGINGINGINETNGINGTGEIDKTGKMSNTARTATPAEPNGNFCVVCGRINSTNQICDACGHSLINPKNIFGNG